MFERIIGAFCDDALYKLTFTITRRPKWYGMALGRLIPAVNKNLAATCDKLTTVQQLRIAEPHIR